MTNFALICPPFLSHVRAFEALGRTLAGRGHRVDFVVNEGAARFVREAALGVHEVRWPTREAPGEEGAMRPAGLLGILRTVREAAARTDALCAGAPAILAAVGADVVIGDQMEPAAGLLAAHLALPHVSLASALPIDADPAIPPPYLDWDYDPTRAGLKRNRGGTRVSRLLLRRQRETIEGWSRRFGLPERRTMEDCLSPLATIAQTVPGFDFPREAGLRLFGVGPLREPEAEDAAPPFRRDPARPLVFASLGSLQGHRVSIFRLVARACRRIGAQLVVAHCGRLSPEEAATIGADFVTDFLPQRAMLAQADLCVTHAGLNTVLDALAAGRPMLCVPVAFDQPGVAARVAHHGAGLKLRRRRLTAASVEAAMRRLLDEPRFAEASRRLGAEIAAAGGCERAADIVERVAARARAPEPA